MATFSRLVIASAVAAALAAPAVLAQTGATGSETQRGATEVNPSPAGQPNPGDRMSSPYRRGNETGSSAGTSSSEVQRNATDIRPGGQATQIDRSGSPPNRRGNLAGTGAGNNSTSEIERNATPIQPEGQANAGDRMNRSSGSSMRHGAGGHYGSATVRDAQQALQAKGYDVGQVDGVMGPRTQAAVRDFQQQQGLTTSGRLDQATLSALSVSGTGSGATELRPGGSTTRTN